MPKTQAKRGMSPRELDALRKRYVAEQKQADSASKWQLANDIVSGINDIVGRGVIAPILGMPGDINQAIYDAGAFVNNKIKDVEVATGMVKQPRYVRPTQGNAYLGSEDIGNRMQQAGLVSSERRPMTELAASLVSPGAAAKTAINAPKTAMNMLRMAENLEAPSRGVRTADGMYIPRGQMGAIELGKVEAPQAKALREAQINAAKPVSEGGLGLRPDNTPEERAAAMGFEDGWYHGTGADIREMNTEGVGKTAGSGAFVTDSPLMAETYVPGQGQLGNIMPLMVNRSNMMDVNAKGKRWSDLRTNDLAHNRKSLVKMFPKDLNYNDFVTTDNIAALAPTAGFDGVVIRNVIDNGPNSHVFRAKEYLRDKYGIPITEDYNLNTGKSYWDGVTGEQFAEARKAVEKAYNKKSNIISIQKPQNIRSRFAAFDPMRRNSSDLLAGIALPVVAAPVVSESDKKKRKDKNK